MTDWIQIELIAPLVALLFAKFVPNEWLYKTFKGLGTAMTLGLSKLPYTRGVWNKTIEPWVIDGIDHIVKGFFAGLRSDAE